MRVGDAGAQPAVFLPAEAPSAAAGGTDPKWQEIATKLEECNDLVSQINANAESIEGNLEHVNRTGGVVAGALPLLYDMAEGIVTGATYDPEQIPVRGPAAPASGRRRSRMHEGVGYRPE